MKTQVSGLPTSYAEQRAREIADKKDSQKRHNRIMACPSGQKYTQQPTPADKAFQARMLGEKVDDAA